MTVNSKEEIGYKTAKHLHQQPIATSCDQVIDRKVLLPPGKECLYVPSKFIDHGDLFGCKIIAIRGNPVLDAINPIADNTNLFLGLVLSTGWMR